jgi:hypothetical protein
MMTILMREDEQQRRVLSEIMMPEVTDDSTWNDPAPGHDVRLWMLAE